MAVQLGLSASTAHCFGIRGGVERRRGERRSRPRTGPDRRRIDRRRATFSSLVFSLMTIAFPTQLSLAALRTQIPHVATMMLPSARVTVSIDSFIPVQPRRAYEGLINEAAKRYRVEPGLIRSVMQIESAYNPVAVSRAGAMGLMQLMPDLAVELGVIDPFDPRENVMAGARHLRRLLGRPRRRRDAGGGQLQRRGDRRRQVRCSASIPGNPELRAPRDTPALRVPVKALDPPLDTRPPHDMSAA